MARTALFPYCNFHLRLGNSCGDVRTRSHPYLLSAGRPPSERGFLGQDNGAPKFTVDGKRDVNIAGHFTGRGTALRGITFSPLTGQLGFLRL